jgi:hypothetical protein
LHVIGETQAFVQLPQALSSVCSLMQAPSQAE